MSDQFPIGISPHGGVMASGIDRLRQARLECGNRPVRIGRRLRSALATDGGARPMRDPA